MCPFFDKSNVSSTGRLRPDIVVPYAVMPTSHLLPMQVSSPFLCWYLFTLQRVTGKLVSSVPAQKCRFCEVPKSQVTLKGFINCIDFFARFKCNEQNEEELQTSNASDLSTECQYLLYGHPWENLQMTICDLDPTQIFATQSLSQALGQRISNPSPRQDVK